MRKTVVAVLLLSLDFAAGVAQRKLAEDDPQWRQEVVQRAFAEVAAGKYASWTEKYLARLGDSAAPEIMKVITAKNLSAEDTQTALLLINMSFANPRLIRRSASRTPTNALVLLQYLDVRTVDSDMKAKISSVRNRIQSQPLTTPQP